MGGSSWLEIGSRCAYSGYNRLYGGRTLAFTRAGLDALSQLIRDRVDRTALAPTGSELPAVLGGSLRCQHRSIHAADSLLAGAELVLVAHPAWQLSRV